MCQSAGWTSSANQLAFASVAPQAFGEEHVASSARGSVLTLRSKRALCLQAFDEEHVDLDQERTGAVLYLHQQACRVSAALRCCCCCCCGGSGRWAALLLVGPQGAGLPLRPSTHACCNVAHGRSPAPRSARCR